MKTAIILSTAFITTTGHSVDSEKRIKQYIKGFEQIGEVVKKYPNFDVYAVDNTVEDISRIDQRLITAIDTIQTIKGKIFFFNNEYGKKNKGTGLIAAWKGFLSHVSEPYEYIISFEPRQEFLNFSFFEHFVKNPNSYFKTMRVEAKKFRIFPIHLDQVVTSFVAFRRREMESYCNGVDLVKMVKNKISIEDDLYNFLEKNKVFFGIVDKLGILWHDSANNKYIEL